MEKRIKKMGVNQDKGRRLGKRKEGKRKGMEMRGGKIEINQ